MRHSKERRYLPGMRSAIFGPKSIALSLTALLLIFSCLSLAQWQWDRKLARDSANTLIASNIDQSVAPAQEFLPIGAQPAPKDRWRHGKVSGVLSEPLLVRNRYSHGEYGYGVVATLIDASSDRYWIDLGWIPAGLSATDIPRVSLPKTPVTVTGRVRGGDTLDRPGPRGSLFGVSGEDFSAVARTINTARKSTDRGGYLEAESFSPNSSSLPTPIPTPEISAGPHAAYALQWFVFALLIAFGRFLLLREDIKSARTGVRKVRGKGHHLA